ncbi:hypothetical protein ABPG72_017965 [Tetrahymena utriculariae]
MMIRSYFSITLFLHWSLICLSQIQQNTATKTNIVEISQNNQNFRLLQICNSDKSCLECDQTQYLFDGQCFDISKRPDGLYCNPESRICKSCKIKQCKDCDQSLKACLKCSKNYYNYKQLCYDITPINTYCNPQQLICQSCIEKSCLSCESSLKSCVLCKSGEYLYNGQCFQQQPEYSFCVKENNFMYESIYFKCLSCSQNCKTCSGVNENECLSCKPNLMMTNNTCIQNFMVYKSAISEETSEKIGKSILQISSICIGFSIIFSILEGFLLEKTDTILITHLNTFKVPFMILTSTMFPLPIYLLLQNYAIVNPIFYLVSFNPFISLVERSNTSYENYKFESIKLSFSILKNAGQSILLLLICVLVYGAFYALTKNRQECESVTRLKVYERGFSSFTVQVFLLIVPITFLSILVQSLEFSESKISQTGRLKEIKILMTFIDSIIILFILILSYIFLNQGVINQFYQPLGLPNITQKKIMNGCIASNKLRRNFMLIYLAFNSFVLPIIQICCFNKSILKIVLLLLAQLSFAIVVLIVRPFIQKKQNIFYIVDQFQWSLYYLEFFALNLVLQSNNPEKQQSFIDSLIWIIVLHTYLIQLIYPFYSLIKILLFIYKKRQFNQLSRKQQVQEQQGFQQQFLFKIPNRNIQLTNLNQSFSSSYKVRSINFEEC